MRRFAALGLAVLFVLAWSGCSSNSSGTVTQIIMTPAGMSLRWGEARQLTAQPETAAGGPINTQAITYASSNSSLVTISTAGVVCAGVWDSNFFVCSPPSSSVISTCMANNSCYATVTASIASGVSGKTTVVLHPTVASVGITSSLGAGQCVSQGSTAVLTAHAYDGNGTEISSRVYNDSLSPTVDPFTWSVVPSTVATQTTCSSGNTCTLTAANPGQSAVTASFSSAPSGAGYQIVTSLPATLTTCPIKSLVLRTASGTDTSATIGSGTLALAVDATDTAGQSVAAPAVQLNSSQPASSTVTISNLSGTATMVAAGTSTLTASCTSALCNYGIYPVFSNPFMLTVSGTSSTAVYAASTSGPTLMPYDATSGTAGTAVTLPYTPNSMVFAPNGASLYLGSASGMMLITTSSTTSNVITTYTALPGTVLSVSPDSLYALVADPGGATVYLYAKTDASARGLSISGARAAAWSPDSARAYVATTNGIVVYTVLTNALTSLNINAVTALDFLAQGAFVYTAGGGANLNVLAICNNAAVAAGSAVTPQPTTVPALVRSLPNATHVLAANSPNIDDVAVVEAAPIGAPTSSSCQPAVTNTRVSKSFGLASFTAKQILVTPDSTKAYILASDSGSLLAYNVATQTASTISLGAGATGATTGGATLDSAYVFVGVTGTNTIHKIAVATGTEAITPISPGFQPDLVAVRPK